jgi:hypothetical protein
MIRTPRGLRAIARRGIHARCRGQRAERRHLIEPISVAGVVDVKDELRLDFQITAREAR